MEKVESCSQIAEATLAISLIISMALDVPGVGKTLFFSSFQ